MRLGDLIKQGFHSAFYYRSLWLFGLFAGISSGSGNSGIGNSSNDGSSWGGRADGLPFGLSIAEIALIVVVFLLLFVAVMVMHFISEGALIEGVVRARQGQPMKTGEAFRAGRQHWTVLLRIGLLYFAAIVATVIVLFVPIGIAALALGMWGAILVGLLLLAMAVPWFIGLHVVQGFATRIAVLGGQRRARTAMTQSWLFVRDRAGLAVKVIVASVVGVLAFAIPGFFLFALAVLVLIGLWMVLPPAVVIAIGIVLLLPLGYLFLGMTGTYRSSVWTIGYTAETLSQ
jgi:hypothetical protein